MTSDPNKNLGLDSVSTASSFPSPPTLAPIPSGYPPPPYPIQYPHLYSPPCKCEYVNQLRYYNHRDKEFYYHNAVPFTTPTSVEGQTAIPTAPSYPYPQYYDPYGPFVPPMAPVPRNFHGGYRQAPYYYQESGICELVLVILALVLWLYSFYRLYLVWQNTLNFSESSIQGPQGWDFLVSWIVERIKVKKLKVPGISARKRDGQAGIKQSCLTSGDSPVVNCGSEDIELGMRTTNSHNSFSNADNMEIRTLPGAEDENSSLVLVEHENEVLKRRKNSDNDAKKDAELSPVASADLSFISCQTQLKQYLSTARIEDNKGACSKENN